MAFRSGALEALMSFGAASIAVSDAKEAVAQAGPASPATLHLLEELALGQERLRQLLASDAVDGICELALSVIVLAWRTEDSLG